MGLKEGGRGHGHSPVSVMLKEVLNKEDMEKNYDQHRRERFDAMGKMGM